MAKRAPLDEQPYRPLLDPSVVSAAMAKGTTSAPAAAGQTPSPHKVIEFSREEPKRAEPPPADRQEAEAPAGPGRGVAASPLVEKFDQEKRILFTRAESQAIDRLVTSLAMRLNAQVKVSHVIRALVVLLLNAEGELDRRAGEAGLLVRPPNGDAKALQRFEREIARIVGAALRDAGPVK